MNWLLFATISIVAISVANIFQRVVMKETDSDPLGSAIAFQVILAVITGIFAFIHGFILPPIFQYPLNFTISTLCYAGGTLALFHAAKRIQASELIIISAVGAVVTIVLAVIFLGESFTFKEGLGTLLILSSIFLVQKKIGVSKNLGSLYAIIGTSLYAVAVVSDTYILRYHDAISYTPVMSLLPGLVLLIARPSVVKRFKEFVNTKYVKNIFLYGFFYSISAIAYYVALGGGATASQMGPISRTQIILTVLLAAIFLKERDRLWLKALGAVIVTIGIILLI